ncbi:MAG: dethiobiotin synthase [Firmicutes bacterium]|nr:dethiobiotin synthase [Bacillota bacterium]
MDGLFVTGTDTDVGKTVIAGAIVRALRARGRDAGAWKPLQSGHQRDDPRGDVMRLRAAAGLADKPEQMCRAALAEPLAPALALERAGVSLYLSDLLEHLAAYRRLHRYIVAEGAGGLLVPLCSDATVLDLAVALAWPLVVVARATLGTVNHTALTVRAAVAAGLHVEGVIISGMPADRRGTEWENVAMIERLARVPVVAVIPQMERPQADEVARSLADQWLPT